MKTEHLVKTGQGYALGLAVMLFGIVATAVIYVSGNGLISSTTGVDLEKATFWFRDAFLWCGVGVSCVLSTLAVADFLGRVGTPLWSWPIVVFLSSGLVEFLVSDHSYAAAATKVIGPVVLLIVSLITVALVWIRAHKAGSESA